MYTLVKILVNLFIILCIVSAFISLVYVWYLYYHPSFGNPKSVEEKQPAEKPQIIKKQPAAPKKPLHFTWKSYVMISLYILVFGYLISLFFS